MPVCQLFIPSHQCRGQGSIWPQDLEIIKGVGQESQERNWGGEGVFLPLPKNIRDCPMQECHFYFRWAPQLTRTRLFILLLLFILLFFLFYFIIIL